MKKIILTVVFLLPSIVFAHPGRTDAYGCHTCKTNCPKWGLSYSEYHCHNSKGLPQPSEPIKSHKTDSGVGYTTPAPEYKQPKVPVSVDKKVVPAQKPKESWLDRFFKKSSF
ncbi:MAG: YHYH domain-containing protein [bacterium]|nr:YHYH domain-containing protein [bacterium]